MKVMQWIALSVALTCLPFAACAQGKPAAARTDGRRGDGAQVAWLDKSPRRR